MNLKEQMDKANNQMHVAIQQCIRDEIDKFAELTGLQVERIDSNFICTHGMDGKHGYFLTGIEIHTSLG